MCDTNESSINCKSTPPHPTNRKIRNPFDRVLIENLHNPICSPGMCKIYKKKSSGSFRWDIDQACTLVPADIVACNSQFEPSPDPALEKIAEEANEKFFSQEMVMPSPLESSKKVKPLLLHSDSIHVTSFVKEKVVMKDVSAQTVLTLPPELPPEVEKMLESFCTFTQEQNISGDYEITANGSLRRKLFFEEHSDHEPNYDSEQTDDEHHSEPTPPSYEAHSPVNFSPDLCHKYVGKKMKRTFGTPIKKASAKPYHNKILDIEPCFSPIEFRTPQNDNKSTAPSSLASASISPVTKSDEEEKNNFTSPESDAIANCLDCVNNADNEKKSTCLCKKTPNKYVIKRSASLKESLPRSRKGSFSILEKRSLSMSSLHRSRSVQKLDFSMDMSIDGSIRQPSEADSDLSPQKAINKSRSPVWSIVEETSIERFAVSQKLQTQTVQSKIDAFDVNSLDYTPVKSKNRSFLLSKHEISKIRASATSPLHMSLDCSLDTDTSLSLEHKKIDFNTINLNFLTDNASQYECSRNVTKADSNNSSSFKKIDSGFNENTFFTTNASSFSETLIENKENVFMNVGSDDFDKFLGQGSSKSMSDIFTEDMTFNCNFSSTPSKNKSRKLHS